MRVPLSWLNEFVTVEDIPVDTLAERLTLAGLEVKAVERVGDWWDMERIRVGQVLRVERHPNADRLLLATVDYGGGEPLTVVTGAPNVRPGMKVAFALAGATLINGYSEARERMVLEPRAIRGIPSQGMVLSERELGLSDEHEGILELEPEAPVGAPLREWLGDTVLEIDILPNIARCMNMVGVAREVAALYRRPLHYPSTAWERTGEPIDGRVEVEIQDPKRCHRFVAALITDVQVGPSPAWMQRRLRLAGMRPINNIVDITNYVMLELGEPLHAFDYEKLVERARRSGHEVPRIIMRQARDGERLITLDGVERHLTPDDILVTDTAGVLSIAGIMGGAETEVDETTRHILLEAAAWDFISIRRTSRRLGIFSEAAARFSRGVHPALALEGNRRAARLMHELAGGTIADGVVDNYPAPPPTVTVEFNLDFGEHLLGMSLDPDEVADILERLEFHVERRGPRHFTVTQPDHRLDIAGPADIVEEIVRVVGLDTLPSTLMADELPPMRPDRLRELEARVRDFMVGAGLQEIISYALTTPEAEGRLRLDGHVLPDEAYVRLLNPTSADRRVMRRTLLVSLVEALRRNVHHRDRVMLFEIGRVYLPKPGELLPHEELRLGVALTGPVRHPSWLEPEPPDADFFAVKGILEALCRHLHLEERVCLVPAEHPALQPGRSAAVELDGRRVGIVGEMHPLVREANDLPAKRVALLELTLSPVLAAVPETYRVEPVPRYPAVIQDLAVVVPEATPAADVERIIRKAGGNAVGYVHLFDVYRGEPLPAGHKSLAYRLHYQAPDRTLTDEDVVHIRERIVDALRQSVGGTIRGAVKASERPRAVHPTATSGTYVG
ncbi:MAG: phenylalanine--tRNA ligase subunit beta [Ardenticatenia bacterium]|nr:phenylalanine--tRNA ligase subunit beta [Ardenticatenia bacterium]